ncbi:MAG: biopolymer transporter ExbD [Thiohalocapsa sp.]|jgi:biopolymer transport protein ExbD
MDSINVIPFIDIMLVLLAVVLTTATFIVEGRLGIRLPDAASHDAAVPVERIEVAVDRDGTIFVDGAPKTQAALERRLADLDPRTPVVLRVDADARFASFVAVVDLLKARDMARLSILTQPANP